MKAIIHLLIIMAVFTSIAHSSVKKIDAQKLFGIHEVSLVDLKNKALVLKIIDSLKTVENVEFFVGDPWISEAYIFEDLPCIQLYAISDDKFSTGTITESYYKRFLFNTCDSTVYPFGGGGPRFSNVLRKHLPLVYESGKNKISELINLYINTVRTQNAYYILKSIQDYENIWKEAENNGYYRRWSLTNDFVEKDIEVVKKEMRFFEIINEGSFYEVHVTTWNYLYGDIELWIFRISNNVFEVRKTIRYLMKMGPYHRY